MVGKNSKQHTKNNTEYQLTHPIDNKTKKIARRVSCHHTAHWVQSLF